MEKQIEETKKKKRINWIVIFLILFLLACVFLWMIPSYLHVRSVVITVECKDNLRYLGMIVEIYSGIHNGHFPQNLEILKELNKGGEWFDKFKNDKIVCGINDDSYIYEIHGWDDDDFTIWCPNPNDHMQPSAGHRVKLLYYHFGEGLIKK